jgi:xylulokinase
MIRGVLGIDVGTTAVKATWLDEHGRYRSAGSDEYPLYTRFPGWAEEDPADWLTGVEQAVHRLLAELGPEARVDGVGVCGMVPAVVLLDRNQHPLRFSIQQNDARTAAELDLVRARLDDEEVYARTGSRINQQHVLPKLLWLRTHEPDVVREATTVMGSYDYVRGWLTGQWGVEENWAVESGLYDVRKRTWVPEWLRRFDLRPDLLPSVERPAVVVGGLLAERAERLGLPSGIPVVAGSADHVASALAAGVTAPGDLLLKFGGAGDILFSTDAFRFHPHLYFDLHDVPNQYLINGCMASSGSLVRWYLELIGARAEDLPELDRAAAAVPPGSDGVVVLPYFLGEKTPLFDPTARGIVYGLLLHHRRAHLFRAILESVIYGFRHHVDELEAEQFHVRRVFASNGGARSRLWSQIMADVLGRPVSVHADHPGSALGAAYVAAVGTGLVPDWQVETHLQGAVRVVEPDPEAHRVYDDGYALYRDLYRRLIPTFPQALRISDEGRALQHG